MGASNIKHSFDLLMGRWNNRTIRTPVSECRIINGPVEHLAEPTTDLQKASPYYIRPKGVHLSRINPIKMLPSSSSENEDDDIINSRERRSTYSELSRRKETPVEDRKKPIKLEKKLKFRSKLRKRTENQMDTSGEVNKQGLVMNIPCD